MQFHNPFAITLAIGVLSMVTVGTCDGKTAADIATSATRPEGAPRLSDVSMRLFRKMDDQKELEAAKAFHITRADWSYIKDAEYIKEVHDLGWTFQGTVNAITHNADHAIKTEDGKPMVDHFGKDGRYFADMENASYRAWYLDQLTEWAELGVDSIQRDEPTSIGRTPVPVAARFHADMHTAFGKRIGRRVPMSCNVAIFGSVLGGHGAPVTKYFDFGMSELGPVRPDFFQRASRDARRLGKAMVFTANRDLSVAGYRRAIAGCYATGMNFVVPWDQFGGVHRPRVFSRPQDLTDLYGFVRANAGHLDGYEDVAASGHLLKASDWSKAAIGIDGNNRVSAFVRAKPGDHDAPVVVHLVDWGKPAPLKVRLHVPAFFASGDIAVSLRVPVAYDARLHAQAEKTKDYAPLSRDIALKAVVDGEWAAVEIPALAPWGMLVVSRTPVPNQPEERDGL